MTAKLAQVPHAQARPRSTTKATPGRWSTRATAPRWNYLRWMTARRAKARWKSWTAICRPKPVDPKARASLSLRSRASCGIHHTDLTGEIAMLDDTARPSAPHGALPHGIGVGYKAQHYNDLMTNAAPVEWLEIHAENYLGDGGRPLAQLRALSERFAISVHGVGLSIGGEGPLDSDHLDRLRHLVNWLNPASFSEHLAWSTHDGAYLNDLLPLPYTPATLARVSDHIDALQEAIGRPMLLENPSSYLAFEASTMSETDFLAEVAARTGCGLLLDVNNVFISAHNLGLDARSYILSLIH